MRFHILTIFPQFFDGPLSCGILGRARDSGLVEIHVHDLRKWTSDTHRTVDDRPYGGDEGMVLKVQPIDEALHEIDPPGPGPHPWRVLLSARGELMDQATVRRLAGHDEIVLVCGRYEGVDERVVHHLVHEELSVGSYVLSGGEWAAGAIVDAVARICPGVVGNERSTRRESFEPGDSGRLGILDYPQYTRPATYRPCGSPAERWDVPELLLSGDHARVAAWRRQAAVEKTALKRPDLLEGKDLSEWL